jgi:N-acetylmuramoyl-L-alanine amidase
MASQAGVGIPEILAGPILQRVTPKCAVVWMVTSAALDQRKVRAEVWDPLPDGFQGFISEPSIQAPVAGSIDLPTDVDFRKAAPKVWVYRIRITATSAGWPANRALAYRIAPHGRDWLRPSDGVELLPGGPGPAPQSPGKTFAYPWFSIDPTGRQWAVLALAGGAPPSWIEAETYLRRLSRGASQLAANATNSRKPNVPAGRPTTALLFSADAIPQDEEILERIKWEIGRDFSSHDFGEHFLAKCLAVSPALWDFSVSAPPSGVTLSATPSTHPITRQSVVALSKIAAHVPLYGLPSELFQITGTVDRLVANEAFATCFLWGNQNDNLVNPALPEAKEETAYSTGEPPHVRVLFKVPDKLEHPDANPGANQVFPSLTIATPQPVLPNPRPPGFALPELGAIDNLFALSTDDYAYLNVPDRQIDEKARMTDRERAAYVAQDWTLTGQPAHRVYQLAIAPDAGNSPPASRRRGKERNWNARTSSYADGAAADMVQATAAFSVLSSEAARDGGVDWPGFRLSFFRDADHGRTVSLMRVGHRVIPQSNLDVFLGNRFRTIDHQTDDGLLAGIQVLIDGQQRATTDANGRATGLQTFLSTLGSGKHTLAIAGRGITLDHPPDPSTARPRGDRIWRERSFNIVTQAGQIIQVDDEQVVAPGVRILLDPVYMRWRLGFSMPHGSITQRVGGVQMVIIHRTDSNDSVRTADTIAQPLQPRGRPFFSQYLLARDGTLIKGADENEIMNHAPGRWQTAPGTILAANANGIGIEMSKLVNGSWYTDAQYRTLLWLLWQYVNANPPVNPLDIVGHSDVQPDGRDDPGLAFEWAQLESHGFGLIRDRLALVWPLPDWPARQVDVTRAANQEIRSPTAAFVADINQDVSAFPGLFQAELAQPNPEAAVRQRVRTLLEEIGYNQTGVPSTQHQPNHTDFGTELLSFRSHFFSGARRTYFAFLPEHPNQPAGPGNRLGVREDELLRPALENNPIRMRDLTAVWALRVRDFVVNERQSANPAVPDAQPVPPPAR